MSEDKQFRANDCTVRRIDVIEVAYLRGLSRENDPVRQVRRYFTLDGELLAEVDTWNDPTPGHRMERS